MSEPIGEVEIINPDATEEAGLPVLAGYQLTRQNWEAFEAYCGATKKNDAVKLAAKAADVMPQTIRIWQREPWWAKLFDYFMATKQQDFHRHLLANSTKFSNALVEVADGKRATDSSARAAVEAASIFAKMGPKPLLETRAQIQNNNLNVKSVSITVAVLEGKTQNEMLKMATGLMPAPTE